MFGVSAYFYDALPADVPIHWNSLGEIDGYASKMFGAFFAPALAGLMTVLFYVLRLIDPRRKNYESFANSWGFLQVGIIGFLAYLHFVTLYLTFNPEISIIPFILGGIGALFVLIGSLMHNLKQNYFVGIKTPWTLHDEKVWDKTHQFGGWCFSIAGFVMFIEGFVQFYLWPVFILAVVLAAVVPFVYSYLVYRRLR